MQKRYDNMRNPWVAAATDFFGNFGAQRQAFQAQEAQMEAERNQSIGEGVGAGVGGFFSTIGNATLKRKFQELERGDAMALDRFRTDQNMRQQAGLYGQQRGLEQLRTDENIRQAQSLQSLAESGMLPADRDRYAQEAMIAAAKSGALDMGSAPAQGPIAPPADQGGFFGPPAPQQQEQLPSGLVRDYHPTTLRNIRDIDEAMAKLDADQSMDQNMKSMSRQRLAQARAQQLPMVMRKQPGPPTVPEMIQQGMIYTDPATGQTYVPKGYTVHDPASKPPAPKPLTTPEEIAADVQSRIVDVNGQKYIRQPDGTIEESKPQRDTEAEAATKARTEAVKIGVDMAMEKTMGKDGNTTESVNVDKLRKVVPEIVDLLTNTMTPEQQKAQEEAISTMQALVKKGVQNWSEQDWATYNRINEMRDAYSAGAK